MNFDFQQPSSTITSVGVAVAILTAFWAVYEWVGLGPEPTSAVVSATTGAIAALVGYLKKENVYEWTSSGEKGDDS